MKLIYELDLIDTGTPYVLKAAALFREAARALELEAYSLYPGSGPVVSNVGHEFKNNTDTLALVTIEEKSHAHQH